MNAYLKSELISFFDIIKSNEYLIKSYFVSNSTIILFGILIHALSHENYILYFIQTSGEPIKLSSSFYIFDLFYSSGTIFS